MTLGHNIIDWILGGNVVINDVGHVVFVLILTVDDPDDDVIMSLILMILQVLMLLLLYLLSMLSMLSMLSIIVNVDTVMSQSDQIIGAKILKTWMT